MNQNKFYRVFLNSIFALATCLFISCNSQPGTQNSEKEHGSVQNESKLELNNGSKWKINPEMKPHLDSSSKLLDDYVRLGSKDYTRLASEMSKQNDALISSCTMQGPDHDALHKWLHPHMELIKELSNADDERKADEVVTNLKESLNQFYQYFE